MDRISSIPPHRLFTPNHTLNIADRAFMLDYIEIPHTKVENTLYAVIAVNERNKLNEK